MSIIYINNGIINSSTITNLTLTNSTITNLIASSSTMSNLNLTNYVYTNLTLSSLNVSNIGSIGTLVVSSTSTNGGLSIGNGTTGMIKFVDSTLVKTSGSNFISNQGFTQVGTHSSFGTSSSKWGFGYFSNNIYRLVPMISRNIGSSLSVNNATTTTIAFNTTDIPDYNSTNTGLSYSAGTFTNVSGETRVYQVSYFILFGVSATGFREAYVLHSSSNRYAYRIDIATSGGFATRVSASATIKLLDSETIMLNVYQNSGGSLSMSTGYMVCTLL